MDTIDWIVIVIVLAAFVYELYKWNGGAMYAKTFRFVLAYFLLPPCFLHAGQKVQPELHLQLTDTRMVKNELCSVEACFQQLPDDSRRIFFQARLTRQFADGSEESGRILSRGEILKQGDIEKQKSKATHSCYENSEKDGDDMHCSFCHQPISFSYPATHFVHRWSHTMQNPLGDIVGFDVSLGFERFRHGYRRNAKQARVMKQEKCIIRLGNEWLVCFWGEIDGEICGLLTYPLPAPLLLKYPQ